MADTRPPAPAAMRIASVALLLALAAPALAQDPIPDTTSAWRYYPLQVGNVWQYDEVEEGPYGGCWSTPCRFLAEEEVVSDTLVGGQRYFVIVKTRAQTYPEPSPPETFRYAIRFDTLGAVVVFTDGSPINGGCRLDEAFPADPEVGREIECSEAAPGAMVSGGYDQEVIVGGDTVTTALKAYTYFTGTVVETRYAAGLGLLYYVSEELGSFERALRYVRVGGVEYGEHIPLAGEPPAGRPAPLTLTTHPNPFLDRVTLDLTVPSPQAVTVEVFDVLGRRVYAEEHAVSRV